MVETLPNTARLDYSKREIFLNVSSKIELNTRTRSCAKEPDLVEWIESNFKAGEVFFDIGANVGAYSLVASKFLNDDLRVYSFEPSFITFGQLCRNVQLNGCSSSITPLQIALAEKTGIEVLNYNNLEPGGALHALGACIDYKGDAFEPVYRQPVISFAADDLLTVLKVPQPNHIKIDVDGIELPILRGASNVLKNRQLRSVVVELEKGTRDESGTLELLTAAGFKLVRCHKCLPGVNAGPLGRMHNYFFLRHV